MTLDQLARLGTAISGLTTVFGFLLAWRGFDGWRHQKRAERQAEAARRAYTALARFCDGLDRYASRPYMPGPEANKRERTAAMHNLLDERREELAPVLEELQRAEDSAALYLGSPHDRLFAWATALEGQVRVNALLWSLQVSEGKEAEAKATFESAFGSAVRESVSNLRRQSKHAMRPVARYHASPLTRWALSSAIDRLITRIDRSRGLHDSKPVDASSASWSSSTSTD